MKVTVDQPHEGARLQSFRVNHFTSPASVELILASGLIDSIDGD